MKATLTSQERKEIVALLSAGYSRTTAAKYLRRALSTVQRDISENPEFADAVAKAEESSEMFYLSCIRRAALKEQYWRAAAWVLERRVPNRYGPSKPDSLTLEQVQKFLETCIHIIGEELPNEELRSRIITRLTGELEDF